MTEYYCVLIGIIYLCFKVRFCLCNYTGRRRSPFFFILQGKHTNGMCLPFPDVRKMIGKPPTLLSRINKETIKAINHEMVNDTRH